MTTTGIAAVPVFRQSRIARFTAHTGSKQSQPPADVVELLQRLGAYVGW